ncbi:hypothetical protein [Nocardia sp. NPDC051833]|uniref:hypothetical protein n=1 Tax=Nocardia sp. NPDC051833 TaxID=3155674 RepID=UPI003434A588
MPDYPQYRTRSATVQAIQFGLGVFTKPQLLAFCPGANIGAPIEDLADIRWFQIPTSVGYDYVYDGDWVIRDGFGRFYRCEPEDFAITYEPVVDLPGEYSPRGFYHWEPVETGYGHKVFVYESSAASAPHVWLRILQGDDIAAHLNADQARTVRDQLDAWLAKAAA